MKIMMNSRNRSQENASFAILSASAADILVAPLTSYF